MLNTQRAWNRLGAVLWRRRIAILSFYSVGVSMRRYVFLIRV
jgi:hypothetical protein